MIVFGRRIKLRGIPLKLGESMLMAARSVQFRNPLACLSCYVRRKPPKNGFVELRAGPRIHLSRNPHDIVTVMVNFCRHEYGRIEAGWTVIDIGANIGAFTIRAMQSGATRVLAFEPNSEACEILVRNVAANHLAECVTVFNKAVSNVSGEVVFIPVDSSPYNKTLQEKGAAGETLEVETISLEDILSDCQYVDLMKLDCEGAEYQIVLEANPSLFQKVKRIRMELHPSRIHSRSEVIQCLESAGYQLVKHAGLIYWFER